LSRYSTTSFKKTRNRCSRVEERELGFEKNTKMESQKEFNQLSSFSKLKYIYENNHST
jgi:hypothetical protein